MGTIDVGVWVLALLVVAFVFVRIHHIRERQRIMADYSGLEGFVQASTLREMYSQSRNDLERALENAFHRPAPSPYITYTTTTTSNTPNYYYQNTDLNKLPASDLRLDIFKAIEGQVALGKTVEEVAVNPRDAGRISGPLQRKDVWPNGTEIYAFPTRWGELELILDRRCPIDLFWTGPRGTWDGNNQHRVEGQGREGTIQEGAQRTIPA